MPVYLVFEDGVFCMSYGKFGFDRDDKIDPFCKPSDVTGLVQTLD